MGLAADGHTRLNLRCDLCKSVIVATTKSAPASTNASATGTIRVLRSS